LAHVPHVQALGAIEGLTPNGFDIAYARWVLCFTPRPEDVVRGAASFLTRGGRLCIHDYFNYETMSPAPRRASYTRMIDATAKSWRDNGGDPDVVSRLPRILHDAGFDLAHLEVHQRVARLGDTMWHWTATWWRSYGPKLVKMGYITAEQLAEFDADVASMTREHDFIVLPPVFEIMAVKR
jgi:hypothetical protein